MPSKIFQQEKWAKVWLAAAVLIVFGRVVGFDFVNLDDSLHLDKNELLHPFTFAGLGALWSEPYRRLYIPFTYTVWGIFSKFLPISMDRGFPPGPFHALNLGLHLVSVCFLVYPILVRLVGPGAFLAALLYAVHPVQVEAVAWVSGLKDVLAGTLSFAALLSYLRYCDRSDTRFRWGGATVLFYVLAILSKPSAIVLPIWFALFGRFWFRRKKAAVVRESGLLALASLPIIYFTIHAQSSETFDFSIPSFSGRCFVAVDALFFYVSKIVFPVDLAVDYGRTPTKVLALPAVYWAAIVAGAAGLAWGLRRYPRGKCLALVAMFVAGLLPVLGFKPFVFQTISTVADRYLYAVMFVPALLLGMTAAYYANRRYVNLTACSVTAIFAAVAFSQTGVWRDSRTLFYRALAVNPESWLAYNNLGVTFESEANWDEAVRHYLASARIKANPTVWNNIGAIRMSQRRYADAVRAFVRALELQPGEALVYNNLGAAWLAQGNTVKARENLLLALRGDPNLPQAQENLRKLESAEKGNRRASRGSAGRG